MKTPTDIRDALVQVLADLDEASENPPLRIVASHWGRVKQGIEHAIVNLEEVEEITKPRPPVSA